MALAALPEKVKQSVRELPPDEWGRLAHTDLAQVAGRLSPESARIVVVREATAADVPTLVAMGVRFAASVYAEHLTVQPESLSRLAEWLIDSPDGTILVSERDGVVLGMIGLAVHPHLMTGERVAGELFWWVEPDARGGGIRLLKAGEEWARAHGAVLMQMVAPTEGVERLYQRYGYQRMEVAYTRRLGG